MMNKTERNKKEPLKEEKEWFVILGNQQVGPFSLRELKTLQGFTPDSLVWKKGFKEWTKARFVLEIKNLFKDDPKPRPLHDTDKDKQGAGNLGKECQVTLALHQDPYQFLLWMLLLLILIFYILYYH